MPFSYTAVFTGGARIASKKFRAETLIFLPSRSWRQRCVNPSWSSWFRWEFQPSGKLLSVSVRERRTGKSNLGWRVWLLFVRLNLLRSTHIPVIRSHLCRHWIAFWTQGKYLCTSQLDEGALFWRNQILIRAQSSSPSPPLLRQPSHSLHHQQPPQTVAKTWWSPPTSY